MEELAQTAQARVGTARSDRLAQLEKSIQAGTYQPNVSRIANGMFEAAELDHSVHAMLGGKP